MTSQVFAQINAKRVLDAIFCPAIRAAECINQRVRCAHNVHLSVYAVGISCRRFLLDPHDGLYRLAESRFDRMVRGRGSDRFPRFAGQRVRMAEALVELIQRDPVRVLRLAFSMLTFDNRGDLLLDAFLQQQLAVAEGTTVLALEPSHRDPVVLDERHRFVAQGGRWVPSATLERAICQAALGRIPCTRL